MCEREREGERERERESYMEGVVGFAKRSACALVTVTVNWWRQWCDFPLNAHTMFPGLILLVASASVGAPTPTGGAMGKKAACTR